MEIIATDPLPKASTAPIDPKDMEDNSKHTLFVSSIPYSASSEDLLEFFSEIGPIRSCFVVSKKESSQKNIGFGYVHFALPEDAERAIVELKKKKFQDKRTLRIQYSLRKQVILDKKDQDNSDSSNEDEKSDILETPEAKAPYNRLKLALLITELPLELTRKQLQQKVRKYGTVKEIIYPFNDSETCAKVFYESVEDAENALTHLHDHIYKGVTIKAEMTEGISRARIIVRNLHFYCKEHHLRKATKAIGELVNVSIPADDQGKTRGFGFIEFKTHEEGERAIEELNGMKIQGREITLDWAVAKTEYQPEKIASADISNEIVDQKELNDTSAIENDEDNLLPDASESIKYEKVSKGLLEGVTLFVRNLSFETTQDALYKSLSCFGKLKYARIVVDPLTGHSKGTGFVCYHSQEDADKCIQSFEKFTAIPTGEDNPNAIVVAPKKGINAVNSMINPEPAAILESSPFVIDNRSIQLTYAVSRNEANHISEERKVKRRAEDKRNLYLMKEGVIFPESTAAKSITPSELSKRQTSYSERKRLLTSNPNLFVSKTRLSIRNLNLRVDDKLLRKVSQESVISFWDEVKKGSRPGLEEEVIKEAKEEGCKDPSSKTKIIIKQAKILRNLDRIDPVTKLGRSKGYGFVEFSNHADALASLRWMNNNPRAFVLEKDPEEAATESTPINRQRPIVEFAVENKMVIKRRTAKEKSAKEKEDKSNKRKLEENPAAEVEPKSKKGKYGKMKSKVNTEKKEEPKKASTLKVAEKSKSIISESKKSVTQNNEKDQKRKSIDSKDSSAPKTKVQKKGNFKGNSDKSKIVPKKNTEKKKGAQVIKKPVVSSIDIKRWTS